MGPGSGTFGSERRPASVYACVALGVFCAVLGLAACLSWPALCQAPMPGGGAVPGLWAPASGESWGEVVMRFVRLWTLMSLMMTPVLWMTLLQRGTRPTGADARRCRGRLQAVSAYFAVWIALGALIFPVGVGVSAAVRRLGEADPVMALAEGLLLLATGALQLSPWKRAQLRWIGQPDPGVGADPPCGGFAGLRLGLRCAGCCQGITALLLVFGLSGHGLMLMATGLMVAERHRDYGDAVARLAGVGMLLAAFVRVA